MRYDLSAFLRKRLGDVNILKSDPIRERFLVEWPTEVTPWMSSNKDLILFTVL